MSEVMIKNIFRCKDRLILYAGLITACIGLVFFVFRIREGLNLFEFGDETEKFVAAQMINSGQHLYSDVFSHHGPFPYIISHLYTLLVSPNDFTHIRIFLGILALLSCAAIFFTPVYKTTASRVWAAGIYLFLLSSVWSLQWIHMLLYQQIGGFLLAIPFLHLFIPLFFEVKPNRYGLLASGIAVTYACFTAYSFGLSAILLVAASIVLAVPAVGKVDLKNLILPFLVGVLLGVSSILFWILRFADLKGFFVYHFYFNQKIYSEFIEFSVMNIFDMFTFSVSPKSINHTFTLTLFICWVIYFISVSVNNISAKSLKTKTVALLIFAFSVLFVNPRNGIGFHDSGFVIVNFAIFSFACGLAIQLYLERNNFNGAIRLIFILLIIVFIVEEVNSHGLSSPNGITRGEFIKENNHILMKPEGGATNDFIRAMTKKDGDLISLVFNPSLYVKTDRLPASGYYYYLPWQAAYNKNAIAGYRIDICTDIESRSPSIIWFDNEKIWGYSIENYEPCVPYIIRKNYTPMGGHGPLYIRKDLLTDEKRMIKIKELSGTTPSYFDLVYQNNDTYKVRGMDPILSYNISSLGLSGHDAGIIKFDFTCFKRKAMPKIQIFWWGDDHTGPFEGYSVRFNANEERLIVSLEADERWVSLKKIKGIRIDLDDATACGEFTIKNIGFFQRKI